MKFKLILTVAVLFTSLLLPRQGYAYAVSADAMRLLSPNGNESYGIGEHVRITWNPGYSYHSVWIRLIEYGGSQPWQNYNYEEEELGKAKSIFVITDSTPNTGYYDWTIPSGSITPGSYYRIYVRGTESAEGDFSDGTFTIYADSDSTQHPVGANVVGPDGTVYFIDSGNSRSPYTSAGAFLSYKFNTWTQVVTANSIDMALPFTTYTPNGAQQTATYFIPPRNGSLINDKGTVYLITNGLRAGFTSEKIFKELGYSFSNVYPGDTSFMATLGPIDSSAQAHLDGTLISDGGTIYVMKNGYRMGFPSMVIFNSWGYWLGEAVPANSYDRQAPVSGVIQMRLANQLSI